MGRNRVHTLLDLDSESLESLFSLSFLLSHDFFVQILFNMLWNDFGWDGFHGLIFKSTFLVKLFLEFFLSD